MQTVSKVEYLCDAFAEYMGSHDPRSEAYRARNPLALRRGPHLREYRSWVHGYESALYDLRVKCSGKSDSGLTEFSSIADLAAFYGNPDISKYVADYLRYALQDRSISPDTQLFVFLR